MKNLTRQTLAWTLGASMFVLPVTSGASDRQDGTSSSRIMTDRSSDIVDLYAWMEPTGGGRLYLLMTVFPGATGSDISFSAGNLYIFHTTARASATDTTPESEVPIICRFDGLSPQGFECWAGQDDYVKGRVNAVGQASRSGRLMVFAGPRNDPFFMNAPGVQNGINLITTTVKANTRDAAGCYGFSAGQASAVRSAVAGGAQDSYRARSVLAVVVSIDKSLVIKPGKPVLSIWGSTNQAL